MWGVDDIGVFVRWSKYNGRCGAGAGRRLWPGMIPWAREGTGTTSNIKRMNSENDS